MSRKTFTSEFKQERVELVIRQGYQVKQAAITPEQQRIQALEAQVKYLQRSMNKETQK